MFILKLIVAVIVVAPYKIPKIKFTLQWLTKMTDSGGVHVWLFGFCYQNNSWSTVTFFQNKTTVIQVYKVSNLKFISSAVQKHLWNNLSSQGMINAANYLFYPCCWSYYASFEGLVAGYWNLFSSESVKSLWGNNSLTKWMKCHICKYQ